MSQPASFANGRFEVVRPLGEGGMALVYLAVDRRLRRAVAIKVPRPALLLNEKVIERFAQETVTMARATHPHVVTLYEAGAERLNDGTPTPYLVMELVGGVTAEDLYRAGGTRPFGKLPPRVAARVMSDVLSAVAELHAGGLIHRDIKPSNIMVGWNPRVVKLMDFGIARLVQDAFDNADRQTKTAMSMFSLGFSAPEQLVSAKGADARSDLYAVGATLYALVTGREPEDLHNQSLEDEEFLCVPECLRVVIHGATRYRPSERAFANAEAMAAALDRAVASEPDDGEEALRRWLAECREESPAEAALRAYFGGRRYTLVPEMTEGVAAGFTQWFEGLGDPPSSSPGAASTTASPAEPATRKPAWRLAAIPVLAAAAIAAVAFVRPWSAPAERPDDLGATSVEAVGGPAPERVSEAGPPIQPARSPDPAPQPSASELGGPSPDSVVPSSARDLGKKPVKSVTPVRTDPDPVPEPRDAGKDPVPEPEPPKSVPESVPEPEPPRGSVLLAGGADSIVLVGPDGSHPPGRVPPGTYRIQAEFPTKGTAPNAGTVTVAANQTVRVSCSEAFKLCNSQ